jgi:glutathione synthase/RimK-type ligase-like ATP-grasp enzyme
MSSVSVVGQSRRFHQWKGASASPPIATDARTSRIGSFVPRAMDELGLPLVVKIPDGSFSRGVHKVSTPEEFRRIADVG